MQNVDGKLSALLSCDVYRLGWLHEDYFSQVSIIVVTRLKQCRMFGDPWPMGQDTLWWVILCTAYPLARASYIFQIHATFRTCS